MRSKLILALLLTSAIVGSGASTAQATLEYHGFTGTANTQTIGSEQLLESTVAGAKVLIFCSSVKGAGSLTANLGTGKDELTYETCRVATISLTHVEEVLPACTVANILEKSQSILKAESLIEFSPQATSFAEIKITGATCALKGTFTVTGRQLCAMPRGWISKETHIITCNSSGTSLKLGAEAARLTGIYEVTLASKAFWYRD